MTDKMSDRASKEATTSIDENENIFRSCLQADRHVSFLTDFEEDVGAQHSFLAPECSRNLAGSHLGFGTYELPNCFGVENFSSGFEYEELALDQDAIIDSTLVAEKKAKAEISNEGLHGTEGRTNHRAQTLKSQSGRRDIKTSSEPGAVKNGPNFEAVVGKTSNPQSESKEGRDFVADEEVMHPDSCSLPESRIGDGFSQLDQMTVRKLQDAFRKMFGRETKIRDKQWLKRRILFGIQNSGEVHKPLDSLGLIASSDRNDGRCMSKSGTESCVISPCSPKLTRESETKVFEKLKESASDSSANYSSEGSEMGIHFHSKEDKDLSTMKEKRAHKPTRRYIEETIMVNPRKITKKSGESCKRPREGLFDEKLLHKSKEEKVDGNAPFPLHAGSFDGCIQVPFGLPIEEENISETASIKPQVANPTPKGHRPTLKREPENPPVKLQIIPKRSPAKARIVPKSPLLKLRAVAPQEEPVSPMQKGERRRKHHISWTLSEVMRLIEGVSHLGIGRWSKIKRLLFATSKHRTSVDLKDKWRNLVKASAHLQRRKKAGGLQARKQLSHQAPESVLRRVRELADSRE